MPNLHKEPALSRNRPLNYSWFPPSYPSVMDARSFKDDLNKARPGLWEDFWVEFSKNDDDLAERALALVDDRSHGLDREWRKSVFRLFDYELKKKYKIKEHRPTSARVDGSHIYPVSFSRHYSSGP